MTFLRNSAILKQSGKCGAVISKWLQVGCKLVASWLQVMSKALTPSGDASGIGLTLRENCVNTQKSKVDTMKTRNGIVCGRQRNHEEDVNDNGSLGI